MKTGKRVAFVYENSYNLKKFFSFISYTQVAAWFRQTTHRRAP
jgi:hypothetical protein